MDPKIRHLVDTEWAARLGLSVHALRSATVHVVAVDIGANDAMSFLFDGTCIVVVRPEELEAARSSVVGLAPNEAFTADLLFTLLGTDATVDGPSQHTYANERTFRGRVDPGVEPIDAGDRTLLAFLEKNDIADWAESGFPRDPGSADHATTRFWVAREHGEVVAAGNMTEWRGLPADVGVLTHPDARGRGIARRVAATMVAEMLPGIEVARYRALVSNGPSLAIAERLGFQLYGQNFRARRPRD